MTLAAPHRDFKLDPLLVAEARSVGLDEMMTQLWLRVAYDNHMTSTRNDTLQTVAQLASLIEDGNPTFIGFGTGAGIAESWIRADLVKVLKKSPDQFAVARPVHLPATQLRNVRKDKDSNASAIPYKWIASDPTLRRELLDWLEVDVETATVTDFGDLPSYALAVLAAADGSEDVKLRSRDDATRELCACQGRFFCEDFRALLQYRSKFPRAVLVDHMRRLTSLHVFAHLVRTYAAVVELAREPAFVCGGDSGVCAVLPTIVADCGDDPNAASGRLAERSWSAVELTLSRYVRAHWALRKLSEFGGDARNKRSVDLTDLRSIAKLRQTATKASLDQWAEIRLETLTAAGQAGEQVERLRELRREYEAMGIDRFDVYMAILYADGERRWFNYHRQLLESLLSKNAGDGSMQQPLGGRRKRRVALSPMMLETLALVAMVHFDGERSFTRPLRVDQLVDQLAHRYGLLVASLPSHEADDPGATRAIIENHETLRARLRQAGLFVDLSDAFLTQTIRPRVEL